MACGLKIKERDEESRGSVHGGIEKLCLDMEEGKVGWRDGGGCTDGAMDGTLRLDEQVFMGLHPYFLLYVNVRFY